MRAIQRGDYDSARAAFSRVIEAEPENADAYRYRGETHFVKGHQERAISDYKRAIEINAQFGDAYGAGDVSWYYLGDYSKARNDLVTSEQLGAYVDAAFVQEMKEMDKATDSTKTGWIELQPGRVVSISDANAGEWQEQIMLRATDKRTYGVVPGQLCRYDIPSEDAKAEGMLFQIGNDNQYSVKGYVWDRPTPCPDGLFYGKRIRVIEVTRLN